MYRNIFTYLIFFIISLIFWILNVLNNNYSTNLSIPAKYIHQLPNKRLVGNYTTDITINATAHGYTLIKHMLYARQNPVLISIMTSPLIEYPEKGSNRYYLLSRNIKDRIQRQFPELIVNYLAPDTLFFEVSDVVKQRKKVKPIINIEFEQQYTFTNRIIAVPDCVEVIGPKSILDTISSIETNEMTFKKVKKIFQVKMQLKTLPEVSYNRAKVTVVVPVDKYTEAEIYVPIKTINVPNEYQMKTFPTSIKLTYKVTLDKYRYINTNLFLLTVNYNEINSSINNKVMISLQKSPSIIWDITYKPKTVEFILEHK